MTSKTEQEINLEIGRKVHQLKRHYDGREEELKKEIIRYKRKQLNKEYGKPKQPRKKQLE